MGVGIISVGLRRHVHLRAEYAVKIGRIGKTAFKRDAIDMIVCCRKQLAGKLDLQAVNVFGKGYAHLLFENMAEIFRINKYLRSDSFQSKLVFEMLFDIEQRVFNK